MFKLTPDGTESVLWSFGNGTDGQLPQAGLIMDASGSLYGTTGIGGAYGLGTMFKLTPQGNESVLWSFGNGSDGQVPVAGLIMDTSGNLYGTTSSGGAYIVGTVGAGTVFKLTPGGNESVLWSFGNGADRSEPRAGLIMDANGNLYGTTYQGGAYAGINGSLGGTVFELTAQGNETILWNFGNGSDGQTPQAGLIMDASGNLYGTTQSGGAYYNGNPIGFGGDIGGTVFEISNIGLPRRPRC